MNITSTTPTTAKTPADYIRAIVAEGRRFARAAELGDLEAPIRACPGWTLRDLVRHLGEIHLWAAANVASPRPEWLYIRQITDLARYWPELAAGWPDDDDLVTWYRATLSNLVRVLGTAAPDVPAFTFLPAPTPLTMWARRQASEIAIHRCDVELAMGIDPHLETRFASDMLDELITGFTPASDTTGVTEDRVLQVVAADVDERWWVTIARSGVTTSREGERADLTITGTAADLYLLLWNRTSASTVHLAGNPELMELWRNTCHVEWLGG
jgi:uncharacterized protein (TIGR03083 family)